MKKIMMMVLASGMVIAMLSGCANKTPQTKFNRFEIHEEGGIRLIIDEETDVVYIGELHGLTVLVDREGHPITADQLD